MPRALLDLKAGRKTWVRRWLLIDLAFFSGLRVSEIANLKIQDLKFWRSENLIFVSRGKGGKNAYVTIDKELAKHLRAFLAWKECVGEKTEPNDPLLTGSKNGKPYVRQALETQFKRALQEAGLPAHYHIHCARHTFATYLLQKTKNLRLVQKQLRHASPAITAVYADVTPEDMSSAMETLRT